MTALATTVVVLAALAVAAAAVLALLNADYRKVRETDELVERQRADQLTDADLGDDVIAMTKAWRDEVERP